MERMEDSEAAGNTATSECSVRLEDADTGELFALCPYDLEGKAVEPVLDSSRYFVLRVVDPGSGKHAYLGLGFPDRSDSFDFSVALQDWTKRQQPAAPEDEPSTTAASAPKHDYSLKAGETMSISIGGAPARKREKPSGGQGSGILLPPPPPPHRHRG